MLDCCYCVANFVCGDFVELKKANRSFDASSHQRYDSANTYIYIHDALDEGEGQATEN